MGEAFVPDLGLWRREGPGHTSPVAKLSAVHSGRDAAVRMLVAAQVGESGFPFATVLEGVSGLQQRDRLAAHYGCFRWYAEEPHPIDTNAAFFIGLNLLVLNGSYRKILSSPERELMDRMLEPLDAWFDFAVGEASFHYPNKFMGDLVCSWLLKEQLKKTTVPASRHLLAVMEDAADYWKNEHWGWGEHLSNGYSRILLDELSILLFCSKAFPKTLHTRYLELFKELLRLEDSFASGPRVPTIRDYGFDVPPCSVEYRDTVRIYQSFEDGGAGNLYGLSRAPKYELPAFCFGHLLYERGWHKKAPKRRLPETNIEVPCFGGAVARAWRKNTLRIGSLSAFPIMPKTDHPTWGLSWQSFPLSFHVELDGSKYWGFLRWRTTESGVERAHPALNKGSAFLNNALSAAIDPPPVGLTSSLQENSQVIVLRRMPQIVQSWSDFSDGVEVVGFAGYAETQTIGQTSHLRLEFSDGTKLFIHYHGLGMSGNPELIRDANLFRWSILHKPEDLYPRGASAGLWLFSFESEVRPVISKIMEPTRYPRQERWKVEWAAFSQTIIVEPQAPAVVLRAM